MATFEILDSLFMIFIMILPGIVFQKKHLIESIQAEGINSIVVNLTWPCLVIDAMQVPFSQEVFRQSISMFLIIVLIYAIVCGLALILVKMMKMGRQRGGLFAFMLLFANTGFMGIPVINALYGKEAVFYASIVEMVSDVMIFTLGIFLIQFSAGAKAKFDLRGLLTPGMIGVVIGYGMFLLDFQLPGFLGDSVGIIGSATTPLTMFIIGYQLGALKIKDIVGDYYIYILSFGKLIVIPALSILVMQLILQDTSLMSKVLIMGFAMPVAACTVIFSQQYKADVAFATKGVLISTLFSVATIPIIAIILG